MYKRSGKAISQTNIHSATGNPNGSAFQIRRDQQIRLGNRLPKKADQ